MGEVIPFPVKRSASKEGVFCAPLGGYFPPLFRDVVSLSAEQIKAWGLENDPEVTPGNTIYYTIDPAPEYGGTIVSRDACRHIRPGEIEGQSLVMRHHKTMEAASNYLSGVSDMVDREPDWSPIMQTEHGYFTLVARKTRPTWSTPMLVLCAFHPANNIVGEDHWECRFNTSGEVFVGDFLSTEY